MSRSGYDDDGGEYSELWRGTVARAINGKRGQAFLREMLEAMDAMPEKVLIAHELIEGGAVCAIGTVGVKRGIDMSNLDPEVPSEIAKAFGISRALTCEIEYINDECGEWRTMETPHERFARVRKWIVEQLKA